MTQHIGPVRVTIDYSSPAVHGPDGKDRRGQIWGKLVPYGLTDLGFGNGKPAPWRAGANENTVFAVSENVSIEGKPLPAGRYGLHMIAGPEEWVLIFSKDSNAWGSFYYDPAADALRVTVKPHKHEYREWLTYEFTTRRPAESVAELQWEDIAVPWTIKVENINDLYISKLKENLTNVQGFGWRGWVAASQFCVAQNTHLDQALEWAEIAVSKPFIGEANFTTLSNKAQVLEKMGRKEEAAKAMQTAVRHPFRHPTRPPSVRPPPAGGEEEQGSPGDFPAESTNAMASSGRCTSAWRAVTPLTAIRSRRSSMRAKRWLRPPTPSTGKAWRRWSQRWRRAAPSPRNWRAIARFTWPAAGF